MIPDIRVLVVDDDFRVARLNASYVQGTPGFTVVGVAHTLADSLRVAATDRPDLVLLDEYLPDGSGTTAIGRFEAAVMIVTAAEEPDVVRSAIAAGAVNYVLKPFHPEVLVERLVAFRRFRQLLQVDSPVDQTGIDKALQALRSADTPTAQTRKGRSPVTAEAIADVLRAAGCAVTAVQVADATGVSRATAQRYLADLTRGGRVRLTLRYGSTGRPEHSFEWLG